MSFIGSSSFAPTVSPVNFLPQFEKLGAKLAAPTWLTDLSQKIMFPRIFDNDAHRATLPNLPESHYSVLYSSDHSTGTGYIGRADFDDIEGTWTDSGGYIHSGVNQRETPHPVYDPINNRVNVYVHDIGAVAGETYSVQAARLLTTTDLVTLTDQGQCFPYGHETGYSQVWYEDNKFKAMHVIIAGEYVASAYSESDDGETFALVQFIPPHQNHCIGPGRLFSGDPYLFTVGGELYMLNNVRLRPRSSAVEKIVAYKVDPTTFRPIGTEYYTLVVPGASFEDNVLNNHNSIYEIGGSFYLLYDARTSGAVSSIYLAKSTLVPGKNPSTQNTYFYPVLSDGELYRADTKTVELDWNPIVDDLPATVIKSLEAGSDTSTQQVGTGYRLSGTSTPDLWLYGNAAYDVNDFETLEFIVANLHYTPTGNGELYLGFNNGTVTFDNDAAYFKWVTTTGNGEGGSLELLEADVGSSFDAWTLGYFEGDANARGWPRNHPFDLAVRLSDFGKRVSLLIEGHVTYSKDISDLAWTNDVHPFIRYNAGTELFFTRFTVNTFN